MTNYEDGGVYRAAAEAFGEMADTYDARMAGSPVFLLETTETLSALPDLTDAAVADFACGTGRYAIQAARMGARRVVGVDAAPEMLDFARRKVARLPDGPELPLEWAAA
jgi:ubiquinone/menaquinone biosynthesis C-methylase UbiE